MANVKYLSIFIDQLGQPSLSSTETIEDPSFIVLTFIDDLLDKYALVLIRSQFPYPSM